MLPLLGPSAARLGEFLRRATSASPRSAQIWVDAAFLDPRPLTQRTVRSLLPGLSEMLAAASQLTGTHPGTIQRSGDVGSTRAKRKLISGCVSPRSSRTIRRSGANVLLPATWMQAGAVCADAVSTNVRSGVALPRNRGLQFLAWTSREQISAAGTGVCSLGPARVPKIGRKIANARRICGLRAVWLTLGSHTLLSCSLLWW